MSEPVSNAEIEDVLSSIRRLVSEDATPVNEGQSSQPVVSDHHSRLVLTPAFRVAESTEDDSDSTAEETATSAQDGPLELREEDSVEPANDDTPLILEADDAPEDDATSLAETISELEIAVSDQDDEWEPDGSDFSVDSAAEENLTLDSTQDDAPVSAPAQTKDTTESHTENEPFEWEDTATEDVTDEQLESTLAAAIDTDADHNISAAENVEEIHVTDDHAPETADESADFFATDESVIDEDTLRDMVSDIVRQELQGALGERITRNVRKLVRREINRVLSTQDFD